MANAKNAADTAKQTIETIAADTQKAAGEQLEKVTLGLEKAAAFNQDNIDAIVKSSEVASKAAEGFTNEITAYSKDAFEKTVAAAQDFASAKTVSELFEKQSAFTKAAFEGFFQQSAKMNDMFAATAKDVSKPLNARVGAATEAMKTFTA